jgi:hypothetical protein
MGLARHISSRRNRFVNWLVTKDERFYRAFLLSLIGFFAVLTYFWMLAAGALASAFMWWVFYETIVKRKK